MIRVTTIILWALVSTAMSQDKQKDSAVHKDTFVKFTSHLGNSFLAPSQWKPSDKGDTYSLRSPDGQAVIHAIVFTAKGSGSLEEFRESMAAGLLPRDAKSWKASKWTKIKIGDHEAARRELLPDPESDQQWRLYVLASGKFYFAIILNASNDVMSLNGPVYEQIVQSFHAAEE